MQVPAKLLVLALAAQIAVAPLARAETAALPPMKRLGQGVGDRRTGAKVQLACVGSMKKDIDERGCELLQFLYTDAGGEESLVGPVLDLRDAGNHASREIRDELRCYGLFRHVGTGRFFSFAKIGFGDIGEGRQRRCMRLKYSTLSEKEWYAQRDRKERRLDKRNAILAPVFVVGGAGTLAYFLITGALGTGGAFLFVPGVYASLFVADAIAYPFRLLFQGPSGPLGVKAKNVAALESRAKEAWQIKPKKITHRRFEKLVARLKLFDGRGPKTDLAAIAPGPTAGTEFLAPLGGELEGANGAIALDSTPASRPEEWREVKSEAELIPADLENADE